jgi:hypothetical protein
MIFNTYSTQYKIILATYLIIFLLIVPKFNVIDISDHWQGIRVENFISIILFTLILFNPKNYNINDSYKFLLFCSFIFLSYLVGFLSGMSPNMIVVMRILEYCVFVIFFFNHKLDFKKIILIFKLIIIINLIVSLLQYFELVGFISSRGYFAPDYGLWKSAGIFSGSWESSFITSILYFIIYQNDKKKINIYFVATLMILFLAATRGVMVPFFLSIIILYLGKIKINLFHLIILFLTSYGFYFFTLKYLNLDIFLLFESILRLIFLNQNMFEDFAKGNFSNVSSEYYSWAYRLKAWSVDANFFNSNLFTNLFGTGYMHIYYESFILRILFANGVLGLLVLFILSLRIKFYMIFFLILTGLSVDYVASFKMFIILFLYFKSVKFLEK